MSKNNSLSPIIFCWILIIFFILFNKKKNKSYIDINQNQNKNNNYILKIYQMLFDIDKIFNKFKIKYFIDGGTLLGAERHKGIIPWDDDADICIFENDENKLMTLKPFLNKYGYDINSYWGGYKIYYIKGKKIQIENSNWSWNNKELDNERNNIKYTFPFVDVSIVKQKDDNIVYKNERVRHIWGKCYYHIKDLLPLRKYKFGIFYLMGPNKSKNYLDNCYDKDWKIVKKDNYDHLNQRFKHNDKIVMDKLDFSPALPIHPIINKFT